AALRVPLAAKLMGANALVIAVMLAAYSVAGVGRLFNSGTLLLVIVVVGLHLALVIVALRPIRDLEIAAARVWYGDFGARVEPSSVADHEVLRVGSMFNILLDGLASDRARMHALATEVIAAGDRERAAVAQELQNSTAQNVAALLLQLSTTARDVSDPALVARLHAARDSAEAILEEVRLLSDTMHPGVLDDLGLEAALRKLARDSSHGNGIDIDVRVGERTGRFSRKLESALYQVSREAVRNAVRHAAPGRIRISLTRHASTATLEVYDDGRGFDLVEVERGRPAAGLLSMRERVALVDGSLDIKTAQGNGTTVRATVPLGPADGVPQLEIA
ncbi:MAG: sensor histidine kinase, partial [Gemmatimonadaceae bacterium]